MGRRSQPINGRYMCFPLEKSVFAHHGNLLNACQAVYKARAKNTQHLGDLLYCALVGLNAISWAEF
jgi:hypothetical protein